MTPDPSLFIKRIRHLSQALIISGALNIGVLSILLYWMLRESPPTPYCELKPASFEQQQIPLADQRGFTEVLTQLSQFSFSQLISYLSHEQMIEDGYAERDLALACLIAFHHFDIQRALPKNDQPQQKRLLAWKPKGQSSSITLVVYPNLTQHQFNSLIQFAKTERWPLTAEGLFLLLQEQKKKKNIEEHLVETFILTPEFWTVELLFNRSGQPIDKQEILTILLEGNWVLLKQFVDQQRQVHDLSDARRQKFLLDYIKAGSLSSVNLLLKMEWDFSVKKLDDQQVIAIIQLMSPHLPESLLFAKEMLISPRSTNVWRQASEWLYKNVGEAMPKQWNHQAALSRFIPEKLAIELISKPVASSPNLTAPLSLASSKAPISTPIKPSSVLKSPPMTSTQLIELKSIEKTHSQSSLTSKGSAEAKKNLVSTPIKPCIYVVQEGDSLWKIARSFGIKIEELKAYNHLKSDILKPGSSLKIPKSCKTLPGQEKPLTSKESIKK